MPTYFKQDGFEHNSPTAPPFNSVSGTPGIVTTPVRTGTYALEISAAAAGEAVSYTPPGGSRQVTQSVYIRFASLPAADCRLVQFNNASGKGYVIWDVSAGQFGINVSFVNPVNVGPTIVVNTWYLVDVEFNTTADPAAIKAKVDGGTEANTSRAQAASDINGAILGTDAGDTYTGYFDDWGISVTAGDYPIGEHLFLHTPLTPRIGPDRRAGN